MSRLLLAALAALCLLSSAAAAQVMPRDDRFAFTTNERSYTSLHEPKGSTHLRRSFRGHRRHGDIGDRDRGRRVAGDDGPEQQIVAHPAGCPARLFCGCGVAVHVFGAPIRSLWLAAAWLRFPRAMPGPGMVAARRGHVFAIERVLSNGTVLAYDPNSGRGLTRIHVRSLAGFRVVDPRSS